MIAVIVTLLMGTGGGEVAGGEVGGGGVMKHCT